MTNSTKSIKQTGKTVMASVEQVTAVIILILVTALIVGTLLVSPTIADTVTTGTDINEEVVNVTNLTIKDFAIVSTFPNAVCSLGSVLNSTGTTMTSSNYTQPTTCQITATDASDYIGDDWNVTYNYSNTQNNLGGVNATAIGIAFGLFVAAIIGFFAVIGVIIAIVWLIGYIKPLFSKEDGIQTFTGS